MIPHDAHDAELLQSLQPISPYPDSTEEETGPEPYVLLPASLPTYPWQGGRGEGETAKHTGACSEQGEIYRDKGHW